MANIPSSLATWSATAASNQPDSSDANTIVADLQQIQATVRGYLASRATIASGSTVDLSSITTLIASVTHSSGTTSISSFGTLAAGLWKIVTFAISGGVLNLTHHATQMILPGGANISLANGDSLICESLGSGNWKVHLFQLGEGDALPRGYIDGVILSNNGSDATNDIDIAAGVARDASNAVNLALASALTKRLDAAWSVGTGNGGLDTGSIANATYHVWLIKRSDTGVVDVLFSTSASSPTMPTNYTHKRRIGSFIRTGGAITPFVQDGNSFVLKTITQDIDAATPGASAVTRTLGSVPTGIRVQWIGTVRLSMADYVLISDLSATDVACNSAAFSLNNDGAGGGAVVQCMTNTSAQVRSRMENGTIASLRMLTSGWIDRRGEDA